MGSVKQEWKRVTGEGLLCLSRVWCPALIAMRPSAVGERGLWEIGRVGFNMQLMKLKLQGPYLHGHLQRPWEGPQQYPRNALKS